MQFAQLKPGPAFSPLQSLFYYAQRLVTAPRLRQFVASSLCASVRLRAGAVSMAPGAVRQAEDILEALRVFGYASLGMRFTKEQLADIHESLAGKLLEENGHGKRCFTLEEVPPGVRMADYRLDDILDCPHILQLANDPALLTLAARYIGCKPTLSAVGMRWSFPAQCEGEGLQAFHRDSDDWRFMKVFVYLTDVDEGGGPHVYVKGTHRTRAPLRLRPYSDAEVKTAYGESQVVATIGPAGFAFAADTYGIHKGTVPTMRPRLLLQFQYSILPVYMYRYHPLDYQGAHEFDPYINRLIFQ